MATGHVTIDEITNNQPSPLALLLMAAVITAQKEMLIQGTTAHIEQGLSKGALSQIKFFNEKMNEKISQMQKGGLSKTQMETLNDEYSRLQTAASSSNQNYNNVTSDGNTMLTSLNQVEAQILQFCSIVVETQGGINGLINGWMS